MRVLSAPTSVSRVFVQAARPAHRRLRAHRVFAMAPSQETIQASPRSLENLPTGLQACDWSQITRTLQMAWHLPPFAHSRLQGAVKELKEIIAKTHCQVRARTCNLLGRGGGAGSRTAGLPRLQRVRLGLRRLDWAED